MEDSRAIEIFLMTNILKRVKIIDIDKWHSKWADKRDGIVFWSIWNAKRNDRITGKEQEQNLWSEKMYGSAMRSPS